MTNTPNLEDRLLQPIDRDRLLSPFVPHPAHPALRLPDAMDGLRTFSRSAVASDNSDAVGLGIGELEYMAEAPGLPVQQGHLSTRGSDFPVRNRVLNIYDPWCRASSKMLKNRIPSRHGL